MTYQAPESAEELGSRASREEVLGVRRTRCQVVGRRLSATSCGTIMIPSLPRRTMRWAPDHITILGRYPFIVPESVRRGEFLPLRRAPISEA